MGAAPEPRLALLETAQRELQRRHRQLRDRRSDGADPATARELARVTLALQWCRAGVYGRCCVCATDLAEEQMRRDPAEMRCERCRARHRDPPAHRSGATVRPSGMPLLSFADGAERLNASFVRISKLARAPAPEAPPERDSKRHPRR